MEFGRCDEDYLLHEDCGRVHWHREASVKDSDLLQIRDAEDARRKCLCGLPWGGTGHVSEIYPPTTPHPTVMYGWDEKDVVDQREYPPTTPHPDNPCAQTLIKALRFRPGAQRVPHSLTDPGTRQKPSLCRNGCWVLSTMAGRLGGVLSVGVDRGCLYRPLDHLPGLARPLQQVHCMGRPFGLAVPNN